MERKSRAWRRLALPNDSSPCSRTQLVLPTERPCRPQGCNRRELRLDDFHCSIGRTSPTCCQWPVPRLNMIKTRTKTKLAVVPLHPPPRCAMTIRALFVDLP